MLYLFCFLLCFRARLFIDALWSPAGRGLTSWLSFVMSNCKVVTFPLVSWDSVLNSDLSPFLNVTAHILTVYILSINFIIQKCIHCAVTYVVRYQYYIF